MGNGNSNNGSSSSATGCYRELKKVGKILVDLEQIRITHGGGTTDIAGTGGGDKFQSGIAEFVQLKQLFAAELEFMRKIINSISHADDTNTYAAEAASMRHEVRIYLQRCRDLVTKMTKIVVQLQKQLDKVDKVAKTTGKYSTPEPAPDNSSVIVSIEPEKKVLVDESEAAKKLRVKKAKLQGCRQLIQCYEQEIAYFHQVSASPETRQLDLKIAASEAASRRIAAGLNTGNAANGSISNFTSDDGDEEKEDQDDNRNRRDRRRSGRRNGWSQQQQVVEFEERKDAAIAEQDVIIMEIGKGVEVLHGMAVAQGKEIKKQTAVMEEVDLKLDVNIDKLARENRRLDEIVDGQVGSCRRCLFIFFGILLCSLLFYIYQSVQ